MTMLKIDPEFRDFLPSASEDEDAKLEASLIRDNGATDAICTWGDSGIILDGHRRYEKCRRLKLPFDVRPLRGLADREACFRWMFQHQAARRNWTESQRAMVAAKIATRPEGQPKKNSASLQSTPKKNSASLQSTPPSAEEAAKIADVSTRTVMSAKKVLAAGAPELIEAVEAGDVSVSDAAKIVGLPGKEQKKAVDKVKAGEAATVSAAVKESDDDKPSRVLDSLKCPVPDDLSAIFSEAASFRQAMRAVSDAKSMILKLGESKAGMHLDIQESQRLCKQLHALLRFAMPYTECAKCRRKNDKQCHACRGRGWVHETMHRNSASDADKRWLEARA